MVTSELAQQVLELPAEDRLELARRFLESVVLPDSVSEQVQDGVRRIEEVVTGRVEGLTEDQIRAALG